MPLPCTAQACGTVSLSHSHSRAARQGDPTNATASGELYAWLSDLHLRDFEDALAAIGVETIEDLR